MDLSILIPARNEKYLQNTIDDIFRHSEMKTEVLVGFDGWMIPDELRDVEYLAIKDGFQLYKWIYEIEPIGQRTMTNRLARQAKGKYLMKLDAHCSFAQGFDRLMIEKMEDDMVMMPILCRLDAERWLILPKPFTKKYYFDTNFEFQYAPSDEMGLVETMSMQGSCFMVDREKYWKWNLCDEKYGSWGAQGTEVAIKTYLNGGRLVTNTDVYYGHLFRGVGQNVTEIPYERKREDAIRAHELLKEDFMDKIEGLVKKFNYPGDWSKLVDLPK